MFTSFWLLIALVSLAFQARYLPGLFRRSWRIFRFLRPIHFLWGTVSVIGVMVTVVLLMVLFPPLRWGWLINLTGGNTILTDSVSQPTWTSAAIMGATSLGLIALMLLLPVFAESEEEMFRRKIINAPWWKVVVSCVGFGLAHLIMGIPIAAALGLSVPGFVFYAVAQREYNRTHHKKITDIERTKDDFAAGEEERSMMTTRLKKELDDLLLFSYEPSWSEYMENSIVNPPKDDEELVERWYAKKTKAAHDGAVNDAVLRSTLVHAAHNLIVMSILLFGFLSSFVMTVMALTSA